jgi:hypothetical protein
MPQPQPEENDSPDAPTGDLADKQPSPDESAAPPEQTESTGQTEPGGPAEPVQAQLPPEARGESNGGPLGCCLGIVVGLLLSLSIAIVSRMYATPLFDLLHGWLSITVRIVMVLVGAGLAIAFGYLGWKIGKRAFREYELSPQQKKRLERLQKEQRRKQKQKQRQKQRVIMP